MEYVMPAAILAMVEAIAREKKMTTDQVVLAALVEYILVNGNVIPSRMAIELPDAVHEMCLRNETGIVIALTNAPGIDRSQIGGLMCLAVMATEANYLAAPQSSV